MQVALHVSHYNEPRLQRHVVRILLMVPIYALVSWTSLRFNGCRRWLTPLRECYEAVVLYSFLSYLVECLQLKSGDYQGWLAQLPPQAPLRPFDGWLGRALGVATIEDGPRFMYKMKQVRDDGVKRCAAACAPPRVGAVRALRTWHAQTGSRVPAGPPEVPGRSPDAPASASREFRANAPRSATPMQRACTSRWLRPPARRACSRLWSSGRAWPASSSSAC